MAKATNQVSTPIPEFRAIWLGRFDTGSKIQRAPNYHRRLGIQGEGQGIGRRLIRHGGQRL
jgi:hypothetical protein